MGVWATHWRHRAAVPLAALLGALALSGCNGWFSQLTTSDGAQLTGISCPTTSTCFAVGATQSGQALLEETTDSGTTWHVLSAPALDTTFERAKIACPDAEHCIAVGNESVYVGYPVIALYSSDGGTTWSSEVVTTTGASAGGLTCAGAETCWMTEDDAGSSGTTRVDKTTDGGATWTASPPVSSTVQGTTNFGFYDISCPTSTECVAGASGLYWDDQLPVPVPVGYSYLVSSTDGGTSWQELAPLPDGGGGLACASPSRCLLGAYGAIDSITTADSGATWALESAPIPGTNPASFSAMACPTSSTCVAVDDFDAAIYVSVDGGATWNAQPYAAGGASVKTVVPDAVACPSQTSCWIAGWTLPKTGLQEPEGAVILHTVTGGLAWPSVTSISPTSGPAGGGTQVTVTGAGFLETPTVTFGSGPGAVTAANVTVVSPDELQVTVPPCAGVPAPGGLPVQVTVSEPGLGTSPPNLNYEFTYSSS